MPKRKYKVPGWQNQPVFWTYSVSYKKNNVLKWVHTTKQNVSEASKEVKNLKKDKNNKIEGNEYGVCKTYWRMWSGYIEPITKEEFCNAKNQLTNPYEPINVTDIFLPYFK